MCLAQWEVWGGLECPIPPGGASLGGEMFGQAMSIAKHGVRGKAAPVGF